MSRGVRLTPVSRRLLTALGILRGKISSDAVAALQHVERELAKSPWKNPAEEMPALYDTVLVFAKSRLHVVFYRGEWETSEGIFLGSEDIDRWMEVPEHEEA